VDFPDSENAIPALKDFDLDLHRGELLAIVGESGSGKSVMALSLMQLLSPAARRKSGTIFFSPDGMEAIDLLTIPEKSFRSYRGNRLSMIFQEPMTSLNPLITCGKQLCEALIVHKKLTAAKAKKEAVSLFQKVELPEPEQMFNRYPHQLSGGQKQRVMIAMAICCKPDLLICDEPTTALDVRVQKTILDLLKDLRRSENMAVIFITHDLGLVSDLAEKAIVMLRGEIVEKGRVRNLFETPQHPYTRALLMCRPSLHQKGERLTVVSDFIEKNEMNTFSHPVDLLSNLNADRLTGDPLKNPELKIKTPGKPEVLVRVKDIQVRYAGSNNWFGRRKYWTDAIRDISFEVYRGETLGLVGESGSGKTTVGRALLGLNKPVKGSISYAGRDLLNLSKEELLPFRRNIQIVFQDPYSSLNPRLKVGQAIAEPLIVHESLSRTERKNRVKDLLEKVNLNSSHYNRYPHAFSGGQRQRIVIARALVLNPDFVVFDESVSALDVSVQAQVLNLINDLKDNLGFTAVFISHDLSVVRYLCDRIIVMEKGKIVEVGESEQIYNHPKTAYTKSLIDAIPGYKRISGV